MLDALTITEDEAAGLSELAALDLAMARDFAARAQAAEDAATANDLARSYQRMARSYRQSLALKTRLQADTIRIAQETPATPADERRAQERVGRLREAVERVIWAEHEPPEAPDPEEAAAGSAFDHLCDRLDERLALLARDRRLGLRPLDDDVAAVCATLGLDPALAARWRNLPDPDDGPEPEPSEPPDDPDPAWRGSG